MPFAEGQYYYLKYLVANANERIQAGDSAAAARQIVEAETYLSEQDLSQNVGVYRYPQANPLRYVLDLHEQTLVISETGISLQPRQ